MPMSFYSEHIGQSGGWRIFLGRGLSGAAQARDWKPRVRIINGEPKKADVIDATEAAFCSAPHYIYTNHSTFVSKAEMRATRGAFGRCGRGKM